MVQRIGRLIRFRPGHEAHLYIVVSESTQDEKWLETAIENLDQSKVEYVRFSNFKSKIENNLEGNLDMFKKHGVESIQMGSRNYKI